MRPEHPSDHDEPDQETSRAKEPAGPTLPIYDPRDSSAIDRDDDPEPTEIDDEALRLFFQFTYIPEPLSCFRAVRKLPAGSWTARIWFAPKEHFSPSWWISASAVQRPGLTT